MEKGNDDEVESIDFLEKESKSEGEEEASTGSRKSTEFYDTSSRQDQTIGLKGTARELKINDAGYRNSFLNDYQHSSESEKETKDEDNGDGGGNDNSSLIFDD